MSAISTHRIRISGSGLSRPRGRQPIKSAALTSFESLWQDAVAVMSLATIAAIAAYLISVS
jgi:hypothetical protein